MVFTLQVPAKGDPTFVDRSQRADIIDIVGDIDVGKAVFIHGPSKCGKTTFVRSLFGNKLIRVNCNDINNERHFWLQICASINVDINNVWIDGMPSTTIVAERVKSQGKKILIDNLQKLTDDALRKSILIRIYSLHEEGVACLVCTVRDDAMDIVKIVPELNARSTVKRFPPWRTDDLEKIARQGFSALKRNVSEPLVTTLAQQAFNNPCLMQDYCLKLNNLLLQKRSLTEKIVINDIFVASVEGYKDAFAHNEIAGISGAQLKVNRQTVTLLKVFYLAISHLNIYTKVKKSTVVTEMKSLCRQAPTDANIGRAINAANRALNLDREDDLAFRFDTKADEVYIVNSWFLVYLRWVIREGFGFERIGEPIRL